MAHHLTLTRRDMISRAAFALAAVGATPRRVKALDALVAAHAPAPRATHAVDAVDEFAAARMQRFGFPALSLAIVRGGRTIAERAYGVASIEHGVSATTATVFQIASVTKLVTGIAAMTLVQDGRFTPETAITSLLPEAPAAWSGIQVGHLLSHTSGLPSGAGRNPRFREEEARRRERDAFTDPGKLDKFSAAEVLGYLAELPVQASPGAKWSYNQPGFQLLGMIVERVSGSTYADYLARRLFGPLGMAATQFGDSRVVVPHRTQGAYTRQFGPLQNWLWPYNTIDYPGAGLNTTPGDMARLFGALQRGDLLSEASMRRMWTEPVLATGKPAGYALGWNVDAIDGRRTVGHEGGGCAWVTHLPGEQLTAIVLSNLAGSKADDTADQLAKLALTLPA